GQAQAQGRVGRARVLSLALDLYQTHRPGGRAQASAGERKTGPFRAAEHVEEEDEGGTREARGAHAARYTCMLTHLWLPCVHVWFVWVRWVGGWWAYRLVSKPLCVNSLSAPQMAITPRAPLASRRKSGIPPASLPARLLT